MFTACPDYYCYRFLSVPRQDDCERDCGHAAPDGLSRHPLDHRCFNVSHVERRADRRLQPNGTFECIYSI
jgi:hypothetical protein